MAHASKQDARETRAFIDTVIFKILEEIVVNLNMAHINKVANCTFAM